MPRCEDDVAVASSEIRRVLVANGCCSVGLADLSRLGLSITDSHPFGICFGLPYDVRVIDELPVDFAWNEHSAMLTEKAHRIYVAIQTYVQSNGFICIRVPSSSYADGSHGPGEYLPQKTIATLSGIGWIGKSSLLITPEYGPRIRLAGLLTNMPLQTGSPWVTGDCGVCTACMDACPVGAVRGNNWHQETPRTGLVDTPLCLRHLRSTEEALGRRQVCGLCLKACPVGQRHGGGTGFEPVTSLL